MLQIHVPENIEKNIVNDMRNNWIQPQYSTCQPTYLGFRTLKINVPYIVRYRIERATK
jgi:hypothetical protein